MTEKEKFLGEFEQLLLLSILKLADNAYGSTIRQLLADVINRDVTIGALYTTLDRLEKKGLIESKMGDATPERGGRAKKYFKVSAKGQHALKRSKQALTSMWENVTFTLIGCCNA
ncbi:PadR family transcriptional regulator [Pseudoalteromonas denitrificans]|uniref:Transcriptional regulator, PadR family n=1 Tax=Pseudoalteromonas denitrificans DSM 6059 TaxID=1123010 RepID=A0A1I1UIK9_9GAMM|nr:PadR family transcriptional regulator [Pseudoalteromonas denitrificans]SFD70599.1 transcriptional regulator, PadR family [Pseudoalteromonas denitrificans DSM 6059]